MVYPDHQVCANLHVHDPDLDGKHCSVTQSSQTNITLADVRRRQKGGGREEPVFKI